MQEGLHHGYHPLTDGLVERMNRTLIQVLSHYIQYNQENPDTWDEYLNVFLCVSDSGVQK